MEQMAAGLWVRREEGKSSFFLEEAILPVKDVARLLGENRGKILGCGGEALTRLQSLK